MNDLELADAIATHVNATAAGLARKHNLVCDDGTIVCWDCREREALMPSLHCGGCLGAAYARKGIVDPQCLNRVQTDADKAHMKGET